MAEIDFDLVLQKVQEAKTEFEEARAADEALANVQVALQEATEAQRKERTEADAKLAEILAILQPE